MIPAPFGSAELPGLTPFIYGTTRLGDAKLPRAARVRVARAAMDARVWLHTSERYGEALSVLGAAFAESQRDAPPVIVKLGHDGLEGLRECVLRHTRPLRIDGIELGQLCLRGPLAAELGQPGRVYDVLQGLREEGLVKRYVLEVYPWNSETALTALRAGLLGRVVDGVTYYFNPLQRFAHNPLWTELRRRRVPTIALRTLAGGHVHALRDVPGAAYKPYLRHRASEVAPIFDRSGAKDWVEFCLRFAFSFPEVRATVGSTSRPERLTQLVEASSRPLEALPQPLLDSILALHRRWSDEVDVGAEPWSM